MQAAAAHHDFTASGGRLLGGRYELRSAIARGGMGQVWRATDTLLGRDVAVKVLHSQYTDNPTFLARFRSEARFASLLADPNIATVHDYGESPDGDSGEYVAYLVMELVDGEPLTLLLRRNPGGLDAAHTLSIVRQTASALAAAHAAGVVHRDVKPANILVTSTGAVKLTDFGIAWSEASTPLTRVGQVVGTAHYLAPEQAEGQKATPTSDVYALGVVAYECLAGRRPFEGETPVQTALMRLSEVPDALPAHVPDGLRRLVEHAMARHPGDRLADGAALRAACDALAAGETAALETVQLPIGDPVEAAERRRRRTRAVLAAAAVLVVLAVVLVGLVVRGAGSAASDRPASRATAPASGATTAPPVRLVAAQLIGRPVSEVRARLAASGLRVVLRPTATAAAPAGTVLGVTPLGDVVRGRSVTVTFATAPATTPPAPASASVPSAPASSSPAAHSTTKLGKGKGHGHGHGHGKNG
jgi:serine/threonine-protein kinase